MSVWEPLGFLIGFVVCVMMIEYGIERWKAKKLNMKWQDYIRSNMGERDRDKDP